MASGKELLGRFKARSPNSMQFAVREVLAGMAQHGITAAKVEHGGTRKAPRKVSYYAFYHKVVLYPPFTLHGEIVVPSLPKKSGTSARAFEVLVISYPNGHVSFGQEPRLCATSPDPKSKDMLDWLKLHACEYLRRMLVDKYRIHASVQALEFAFDLQVPSLNAGKIWKLQWGFDELPEILDELFALREQSATENAILSLFAE